MTAKQEAAIWRTIGGAFECASETGACYCGVFGYGLCFAMQKLGLPCYRESDGARILWNDKHGAWLVEGDTTQNRSAAAHRALTAYLMAEMVLDGCAPGGLEVT